MPDAAGVHSRRRHRLHERGEGLSAATASELQTLANSRAALLEAKLNSIAPLSSRSAVNQLLTEIGPSLRSNQATLALVKDYFAGGGIASKCGPKEGTRADLRQHIR